MLCLIAFWVVFFSITDCYNHQSKMLSKRECPLIIEGLKVCCKDAEQMYPSGLAHSTTGLHASC